jgi:hypothetical protein
LPERPQLLQGQHVHGVIIFARGEARKSDGYSAVRAASTASKMIRRAVSGKVGQAAMTRASSGWYAAFEGPAVLSDPAESAPDFAALVSAGAVSCGESATCLIPLGGTSVVLHKKPRKTPTMASFPGFLVDSDPRVSSQIVSQNLL